MSAGQGSRYVEADLPYSKDKYVQQDVLPRLDDLDAKIPAVERIRELYAQNGWRFEGWHAALFFMFSDEDLAECLSDPDSAKYYGDGAELFGSMLVPGRIPSSYKKPVQRARSRISKPSRLVASKGVTNAPDNEGARGSLKRRPSITSISCITRTLKKTVSRLGLFSKFKSGASSYNSFSPATSPDTHAEPSGPVASSDQGKGPMTRSHSATRKRAKETAREQEYPEVDMRFREGETIRRGRGFSSHDIDERDGKVCVVTGRGGPIARAHIIPFSVNSSERSIAFLPSVFDIAERLIRGVSCKQAVERTLMGSPGSTDMEWNIITLTPWLHGIGDTHGLVAYRPRYIDEVDGAYFATFTFHWLFNNCVRARAPVERPLTLGYCLDMVTESEKFAHQKHHMWEMAYSPNCGPDGFKRLEDGKVCRVRFSTRKDAEKMMRMLDLRWAAGRFWFLAGAAGEELPDTTLGYDGDSDGFDNDSRVGFSSDDDGP